MAKQLEMMYEGKAKQVFATDDPTLAVIHYKDDATAFNGLKKGTIVGKGVVNNLVSNHLFKMLEAHGIKTHLVEQLNERDSLVRRVSIVPLEVIVRNIAAGSLSKRLGLPEGTKLKTTVLEYCYKDDELGDPMVNDYHIAAMELATKEEMEQISTMALKINDLLTDENLDKVEQLRKVADELGTNLPVLSMAWILQHPEISCVIAGASKPSQLENNMKAAGFVIPADAMAEIDKITGFHRFERHVG